MIDLNLYGYRTPIKIKRSQSDNEERQRRGGAMAKSEL